MKKALKLLRKEPMLTASVLAAVVSLFITNPCARPLKWLSKIWLF